MAVRSDSLDLQLRKALELFNSGGDSKDEGLEQAWNLTRQHLIRRLASWGESNAEDIASETFRRIWAGRSNLTLPDPNSWYGLLRKTSGWSSNVASKPLPTLDEAVLSVGDFSADLGTRSIQDQVDSILLGPRTSTYNQDILQMRLVLGGARNVDPHGHKVSSRAYLESFADLMMLSSNLVYESVSGRFQACYGPPTELQAQILHSKYLLWKPTSRILRSLEQNQIDELNELLGNCTQLLPFRDSMIKFRDISTRHNYPLDELARPGLWKRIALHYGLSDLSYADITDWLGPVARECGFEFTQGKLLDWISKRRLFAELSRALEGEAWT